jgi:predicted Fe-Mo cluster-binding NifX family protein
MNISRATFGRIVEKARKIVADALINGKSIIIEGGEFCNKNFQNEYQNASREEYYKEIQAKCLTCKKNRNMQKFSIPSKIFSQEIIMKNETFKVAIVSEDGITISKHFGPAPFYEVFTIENNQIIKRDTKEKFNAHPLGQPHRHHVNNPEEPALNAETNNIQNQDSIIHAQGHHHGQHGHNHNSMIENISDCNFAISRGMGYGIYSHLNNSGIEPIITDIVYIEDAVKALIEGTIINHHEKLH